MRSLSIRSMLRSAFHGKTIEKEGKSTITLSCFLNGSTTKFYRKIKISYEIICMHLDILALSLVFHNFQVVMTLNKGSFLFFLLVYSHAIRNFLKTASAPMLQNKYHMLFPAVAAWHDMQCKRLARKFGSPPSSLDYYKAVTYGICMTLKRGRLFERGRQGRKLCRKPFLKQLALGHNKVFEKIAHCSQAFALISSFFFLSESRMRGVFGVEIRDELCRRSPRHYSIISAISPFKPCFCGNSTISVFLEIRENRF